MESRKTAVLKLIGNLRFRSSYAQNLLQHSIEVGFLAIASVALPGVIARVGIVPIGVANMLAAGAIAAFLVWSHQPGRRVAEEITVDDGLG